MTISGDRLCFWQNGILFDWQDCLVNYERKLRQCMHVNSSWYVVRARVVHVMVKAQLECCAPTKVTPADDASKALLRGSSTDLPSALHTTRRNASRFRLGWKGLVGLRASRVGRDVGHDV